MKLSKESGRSLLIIVIVVIVLFSMRRPLDWLLNMLPATVSAWVRSRWEDVKSFVGNDLLPSLVMGVLIGLASLLFAPEMAAMLALRYAIAGALTAFAVEKGLDLLWPSVFGGLGTLVGVPPSADALPGSGTASTAIAAPAPTLPTPWEACATHGGVASIDLEEGPMLTARALRCKCKDGHVTTQFRFPPEMRAGSEILSNQ
jgi:hypothetical protein